jgi:predicted small integral membrane protein
MLRTYAVWHRDRRVGVVLAFLLVVMFGTACYTNATFLKSMEILPAPYPSFRGCYTIARSTIRKLGYSLLIVLQTVVLALMVVNAWRSCRFRETPFFCVAHALNCRRGWYKKFMVKRYSPRWWVISNLLPAVLI